MKGIILAGGSGSRLAPITSAISKQLLPIYDKPMIYYPISVLMLAGIRNILVITTPADNERFKILLGDGSKFGINLEYTTQNHPNGLAEAFVLGEKFINGDQVCLILGDNLFYGQGFSAILKEAQKDLVGARVFSYQVSNPSYYGVVEMDSNGNAISLEEKPKNPKSSLAVTGLYFYDNQVISIAKDIKTSKRGELEITTVNNVYLKNSLLKVTKLGRGFTWMDTGSFDSLAGASSYVQTIQQRQGYKIACLEEIALNNRWITKEMILASLTNSATNSYSKYLASL